MKLQVDTTSVYWSLYIELTSVAMFQAFEFCMAWYDDPTAAEIAVAFALGVDWGDSLFVEFPLLYVFQAGGLAVSYWMVPSLYTIVAGTCADPLDMGSVI